MISLSKTGQERHTLLAETPRADQEEDHPVQGERGDKGKAEEGQTPSQAGDEPDKKGRREQPPPPSPTGRADTRSGESCITSMHERMPRSTSWASQGGTSPTKECVVTKSNVLYTRMKQPILRWPREDQGEGEKKEERKTEMPVEQVEWVEGCD